MLKKTRIYIQKYRYLFLQLVERDFKTKYKRSALGMLWSLLNPLLLMCVQYIVFSNLFRFEIPHYVVYLLIGIMFFNFFNEATVQAMISIVMNANLITKVYVPKYIFPTSKVISASINFLITIIILFTAVIINKIPFSPTMFLLVIPIISIILFSIGIGLILAGLMVYFRDMQFLYGIITTIWMYLTPIFYPENILSDSLMIILKLNPLYHIIKFARTIIIDGTLPGMYNFAACILVPVMAFAIGALIFRKLQRNFILYL